MSGFVIQYTDIYNMLWAYQSKLEAFIEKTEQCQKSITALTENPNFQGAAATAIKNYLNDVHLTILSSLQVTAQNLLDHIVLYKAGYYDIDNSTNFILPEETIKEFRSKLSSNCLDTEEQGGNIRSALYGIADLYDGELPDSSKVSELHEQMDKELTKLVADIENHESSTVKALENSAVQLMTALKNCIGKIGTPWSDINAYQSGNFYTDGDACALAGLSQFFYQQHEDHHAVYDEIWKSEQAYKDAAEERETQGIWKTIGGGVLAVTGTVCIVATGGAATPVAAAGWAAAGGGTIAFGISDSVEGAQDIYYGSMGNIDSTAINGLRDTIFMGNEEAYYFAENLFAFSASAAIPISQAARAGNLTFRLGATAVAKEGISVAAGEGASRLTMELSGNRTASMVAGILVSGAAGHGLNAVDGKFNISGNNTYQSLLGKMSQKEAEAYEHFLKNGSSAGLTEIEQKALQKADARIALNKVDYNEVLKVRGDGIKGGKGSVQHAIGNANQAQSVLDGINPKYFNPESRFGGGFYVGADSDTIVAELAEHGNTAKYAISYDMNLSGNKVLDLTDVQVAENWGYVQNLTSTKACQNIGTLAREQGYSVIKFQSYRGDGINYVIYNNFDNILLPRNVTPVN